MPINKQLDHNVTEKRTLADIPQHELIHSEDNLLNSNVLCTNSHQWGEG